MEMEQTMEQVECMELLKAVKEIMETQIDSLATELKADQAKTDANREADREEKKAERRANREEMLAKMDANMKASQEEMKGQMASLVSQMDSQHEKMMAWLGRMEPMDLEANPEEMQSEAEHQEVPKEHAAVETSRALNKRYWGWNIATECCRKPKDGSWRKFAATRGGTTLHAKVTRRRGCGLQGQSKDNVAPRTLKRWTFGRRYQLKLERNNGIRN
jgi:hypothetical protein